MGFAIGIDLGTTNTVVAAVRDGRAVTLEDEHGGRLIPSVVAFLPQGGVLVGQPAKERRYNDSAHTIYSVKRLIGRPWKSPEVQSSLTRFPFDLREGPKDTTMVVARGEQYALPEVSAFVLRRAKQIAEARLGDKVDKAVITVPANFNDLQRAATKVAGKLAGLEVLRILNEPTAAALAYGQSIAQSERIVVYDLGGGTFDITLLDLSGQVFEVLATAGDTSLGGDDIDVLIAERMCAQFREIHRFDPMSNPEAFGKLRLEAEKMKIALSNEQEVTLPLNEIGFGEGGAPLSLRFRMNRKELEHVAKPLIDKTLEVTRFAMETVGLKREKFDRILLVGGSTRMPLVSKRVEEFFGKPPFLKVNPDEVVALGAAIQAFSLDKSTRKKDSAAKQRVAPVAPVPAPVISPGPMTVPTLTIPTAAITQPRRMVTLPGVAPGTVGDAQITSPADYDGPSMSFKIDEPAPELTNITKVTASATAKRVEKTPEKPDKPTGPAPVKAMLLDRGEDPSLSFKVPDLPEQADASISVSVGTTPFAKTAVAPPETTPAAARAAAPPVAPKKPPPAPTKTATESMMDLPREEKSLSFTLPLPGAPPTPARAETAIMPEAHAEHPGAWEPPSIPGRPFPTGPEARNAAELPIELDRDRGIPTTTAPLLIDVTPISLSVETVGGWCDILIPANSPVPCDRSRVFLTAADGQTMVCVNVAQGESRRFGENTFLGQLELTGLTPKPRGETRIAVMFEIDADGILNVRAKDVLTGRETAAKMRLLGHANDAGEVAAMLARQERHEVH